MDEVDKILTKAAKILKTHKHCKGVLAKNKHGEQVHPLDKKAVSFCLSGALLRADNNRVPSEVYERIIRAHPNLRKGYDSCAFGVIPNWNDKPSTRKSTVINLLLKSRTTVGKKNSNG